MTTLSIVVPTYNLGNYVQKTLASLKKQTIDYELWLVDDHSTDGTAATIAAFATENQNVHAEIFPEHRGVSAARNFGIGHATGDAVAFVDGDDLVAPDYAATLVNGFDADVSAVAVGYEWWRPAGNESDGYEDLTQSQMFEQVSRRGTSVGGYIWNKAYRRSAIEAIGLQFDESLAIAEDYLFTATFVARTAGRYVFDPAVKYQKVNRSGSTIHSRSWRDRSVEDRVFDEIAAMGRQIQA